MPLKNWYGQAIALASAGYDSLTVTSQGLIQADLLEIGSRLIEANHVHPGRRTQAGAGRLIRIGLLGVGQTAMQVRGCQTSGKHQGAGIPGIQR